LRRYRLTTEVITTVPNGATTGVHSGHTRRYTAEQPDRLTTPRATSQGRRVRCL